ncbi:MAG: ABC transporter permease [Pygmaiobacter massiliensis]|nr:ABC transporter permease [Pygmaiobacter massiliensis]
MSVFENVRLALSSLMANKLRALLTMLGIIIGIGSVITIVTIGDSLTGSLNAEMSGFGARNVTVNIEQKNMPMFTDDMASDDSSFDYSYEYVEPTSKDFLTDEMIASYRKTFSSVIEAISVTENIGSAKLTNGRYKANVSLVGTNADNAVLEKTQMLSGRYVTDADSRTGRAVGVVSDLFVKRYFGGKVTPQQALGKSFAADVGGKNLRLYICGVYQYKQPDGKPGNADTETNVYLPIGTAKQSMQSAAGYRTLTVRPKQDTDSAKFLRDTGTYFSSFYTRNPKFTATASSMESMLKSMNKMLGNVKLGISAVAAISLLVGGIGVMNIMMVSVTERTREIGVRMALGAKGRVIRFQFIVEAMIICLIGGIIGVVLGVSLGSIGATLMKFPAKPSIPSILIAVAFSMGIGVFFGYYPANNASKLDPIEALRYE